jgi:DNA-binding IscR family transcriptional regulator
VQGRKQHVKPKNRISGQSQVACEILAYLAEHPEAQDTVEGIAEWWLMEQQIKRGIAQIKNALTELVTQGLVLERKGRDGRIHYCLNRQRSGEIGMLLKKRTGS